MMLKVCVESVMFWVTAANASGQEVHDVDVADSDQLQRLLVLAFRSLFRHYFLPEVEHNRQVFESPCIARDLD